MLNESSTRVEPMLSDLANAVDQGSRGDRALEQLSEIGTTIDLDEVLARTLEAAGALLGVDGAMVSLSRLDRGGPVVATVGLSTDEATGQSGGVSPDWSSTRAAIVTYLYPPQGAPPDPIRGSLAVPVRGETDDEIGTLWVFWRTSDRDLADDQVALLEELAVRASPNREHAGSRRPGNSPTSTRSRASTTTGTSTRRSRARSPAHRYERKLALVVFDIDDFKTVNDRIGHLAGDSVLAEAAERVRSVVRGADIACRVGGDEFAVVLPESTVEDAESLYRRLQAALNNWRSGDQQLQLSAGIAELEAGDDGAILFKRADAALYKAKNSGKGQAIAATAEA